MEFRGCNNGEINSCCNIADINSLTNKSTTQNETGGISGRSQNITKNCYNMGKVNATSNQGTVQLGGISGIITKNIENCYNVGKEKAKSSGNINVGGIVGVSSSKDSSITYCYDKGTIEMEESNSDANIGGICGYIYGGRKYSILL